MLNIPTRANALLLLISITFAPLAHGFLRPAPVPEAAPDARGLPADEKGGPHIAHGENDSYDRRNPDFTTLQQADDALGIGPVFVGGVGLGEVGFHIGEGLGVTAVFHPHDPPVKQRQIVGRVFGKQGVKIGNRFINTSQLPPQ